MKKSLIYTVLITESPFNGQACANSLHFSQALLKRGHKIRSAFFYQQASIVGNQFISCTEDENNIIRQWQQFAVEQQIECGLCITSCLRQGIVDNTYAKQFSLSVANIAPGFTIKGLTELMICINDSDRFIQFGTNT